MSTAPAVLNADHTPAITFLPPLPEVKSTYKPPWYLKVIKVIVDIVKRILRFLCFWRRKKTTQWSECEVQALNKIKTRDLEKARNEYLERRESHLAGRLNTIDVSSSSANECESQRLYTDKEFDPSLQSARQCFTEFVDHTVDVVFEEKIAPAMESRFKIFEELTTITKNISEIIIKLGNHAKDHILQMLKESHVKPEATDDAIQNSLKWLLKRDEGEEGENLRGWLKSELKKTCQDANQKDKPNDDIDCNVEEVIHWVFNEKKEDGSAEDPLDKEHLCSILKVKEKCIAILVDKKLDLLHTKTKDTLLENLPSMTYTMLKKSSGLIAEEVSGRVAELIENVDIEDTLDRLVHIVYEHTRAYIKAKNMAQYNLKAAKVAPKTQEELSSYFYKEIPLQFAYLSTTTPIVKDIVLGGEKHHDKELWKQSVVTTALKKATDTLIDLLFPTVELEIGDELKEVEGLTRLWNIMVFPVEWQNLIGDIEDFAQQLLPQGIPITDKIKANLHENIREVLIAIGGVKLRKVVTENSKRLYDMIVSPKNLEKVLSGYALPAIFATVLDVHVQNILLHNVDQFVEIIKGLHKERCTDEIKKAFTDKLYALTKQHCKQLNLDDAGITEYEFKTYFSEPMIALLQNALSDPALKDKSITEILKKLIESVPGRKKDVYSETVMDLIFQVGEFGSITRKVTSFYTDSINNLVGSMLKVLTLERYTIIDFACAKMKKHLGKKEEVRDLFFSERATVDTSQEHLNKELKNLAAVIHDIAMENCSVNDRKSWVRSYLISSERTTKWFVGTDSTHIENLLRGLINKLLRNEVLNAQLYFKLQELAIATLLTADQRIKEKGNLKEKEVQQLVA